MEDFDAYEDEIYAPPLEDFVPDDIEDNVGEDDQGMSDDEDDLYTNSASTLVHKKKTEAELYEEICQRQGNIGLTKFEIIAVIKKRAKEIEIGKKNTVLPAEMIQAMPKQNRIDPVRLAMKEFELNLFDSKIGRTFPDGSVKYYTLRELRKTHIANTFQKRLPLGGLPC